MQNIHVSRYNDVEAVGYQGTVEPDDRSWIMFIDKAGAPALWIAVDAESSDGQTVRGYIAAADHDIAST